MKERLSRRLLDTRCTGRDLLMECDEEEGPKALAVREAPNGGGVTIAGLSRRVIRQGCSLCERGPRRMTAAWYERASRSHMICRSGGAGSEDAQDVFKLHLVDLAGLKRPKPSTRLQEGIEINKSFMLGNVMKIS